MFQPGAILPASHASGSGLIAAALREALEVWIPLDVFNVGGPMSRTRRAPLRTSMLGGQLGIRWPHQHTVWLCQPRSGSRLDAAYRILRDRGFTHPDEAAAGLEGLPAGPMHYRESFVGPRRARKQQPDEEFLRHAIILGRCSGSCYDPDKPVIWTEGRLSRLVTLFRPGGFYDDDE